jgi:hypothetical protein
MLKTDTSWLVYNRFETFDNGSELSDVVSHNLSVGKLESMKAKRSKRRILFNERSEQGKNELTPNVSHRMEIKLPNTNRTVNGNGYVGMGRKNVKAHSKDPRCLTSVHR